MISANLGTHEEREITMTKLIRVGIEIFLDGYVQGRKNLDFQTKIEHFSKEDGIYIVGGFLVPGVRSEAPVNFKAKIGEKFESFTVIEYSET